MINFHLDKIKFLLSTQKKKKKSSMLLELMEMYSSTKSELGFNINRGCVLVFHPNREQLEI